MNEIIQMVQVDVLGLVVGIMFGTLLGFLIWILFIVKNIKEKMDKQCKRKNG